MDGSLSLHDYQAEELRDVPAEVLYFKKKPVLKDVLALVEKVAQ